MRALYAKGDARSICETCGMTSLDLTKQAPRTPLEQLEGCYMLARTVDKLRAGLPGGNMGGYNIPGASRELLEALEVNEDELRDVVSRAGSDADIETWIRAHANLSNRAEINARLSSRRLGEIVAVRGRDTMEARYPCIASMPDETPMFDVLIRDDRETIGAAK